MKRWNRWLWLLIKLPLPDEYQLLTTKYPHAITKLLNHSIDPLNPTIIGSMCN